MPRNYTPRRASKRWLDGDCPPGVLAIFDSPKYADRYTVFYREPIVAGTYARTVIGYRAMSEHPFHPQGIGLFAEMSAHDVAMFRYANPRHACRWSDLPPDVQRCVKQDLS